MRKLRRCILFRTISFYLVLILLLVVVVEPHSRIGSSSQKKYKFKKNILHRQIITNEKKEDLSQFLLYFN